MSRKWAVKFPKPLTTKLMSMPAGTIHRTMSFSSVQSVRIEMEHKVIQTPLHHDGGHGDHVDPMAWFVPIKLLVALSLQLPSRLFPTFRSVSHLLLHLLPSFWASGSSQVVQDSMDAPFPLSVLVLDMPLFLSWHVSPVVLVFKAPKQACKLPRCQAHK